MRRCGGSIVCGTIHRIGNDEDVNQVSLTDGTMANQVILEDTTRSMILLHFIVIYGIVACLGVLILILVRYDGVNPQLDI